MCNYVATPLTPLSSLPPCVRSHDPPGEKGQSRAWNERFYGLLPSPVCKFVARERKREREREKEERGATRLLGTV